ncbi:MAG TPA: ABC transporter permease [Erysipelothrix sp.]|jgi:D-methionine transport system permease protein|nr:ABC transporter permease [Erysipelothrix sp.]
MIDVFIKETGNTIIMTLLSSLIAFVIGGLLGVLLTFIKKGGLKENLTLYRILDVVINLIRSVPFVILLVVLMPYTRSLVGSSIGVKAMIVPLALAAIPFVGRLFENVFSEVDQNLIEMAQSLGASPFQILKEVILVESWPLLIQNMAVAMVTILGYGAMAGFTGAGGLGMLAISYGYYRPRQDIMLIAVIGLVVLVQIIEFIGNRLSQRLNHKK